MKKTAFKQLSLKRAYKCYPLLGSLQRQKCLKQTVKSGESTSLHIVYIALNPSGMWFESPMTTPLSVP